MWYGLVEFHSQLSILSSFPKRTQPNFVLLTSGLDYMFISAKRWELAVSNSLIQLFSADGA